MIMTRNSWTTPLQEGRAPLWERKNKKEEWRLYKHKIMKEINKVKENRNIMQETGTHWKFEEKMENKKNVKMRNGRKFLKKT